MNTIIKMDSALKGLSTPLQILQVGLTALSNGKISEAVDQFDDQFTFNDQALGLERLESGAQGVLLTLCGNRATRHSADGRDPVDDATEYFDVAVHQVRASSAGSDLSNCHPAIAIPRVLEATDLTILTAWAQALLEALMHAPDRVEHMLVDASRGASWRAMFGITEPSPQLAEAIYCIGRAIGTVTSLEAKSRLGALQVLCEEDRSGEDAVETLVRRVLRSTLYQLRAREGPEVQPEDATWSLRLPSSVSSKWSATRM